MHPQEVAAVSWPYGRAGTAYGIRAENSFSFTAPAEKKLADNEGGAEICR
jgi:hypothetical protein